MQLGYHSITWGGVKGAPQGVTSLKDCYYVTYGSMPRAVQDIAAAGYTGTEIFDGDLLPYAEEPAELLDLLNEHGIELVSVYTGGNFIYDDALPDELDRMRRAAELAATFSAGRLVVGGGAQRAAGVRDDDHRRLADALDRVQAIAADHGLDATYHPHLGTIVQTPEEIERLFSETSIGFCPDTAHLAAGGGDPAALVRRYPDRLRHVHLKDLRRATGEFMPLGRGDLDLHDVLRAVRETGYDSWLIVELDAYAGNPRDAAHISRTWLADALEPGSGSRGTRPDSDMFQS